MANKKKQNQKVSAVNGLKGEIHVPGDKSICHRAVIFGGLAEEPVSVTNFSMGEDNLATVKAFRQMGVEVEEPEITKLKIKGKGLMIGVELNKEDASAITEECVAEGLLINCTQKNILRIMPPLTVTKEEIDMAMEKLAKAMERI